MFAVVRIAIFRALTVESVCVYVCVCVLNVGVGSGDLEGKEETEFVDARFLWWSRTLAI